MSIKLLSLALVGVMATTPGVVSADNEKSDAMDKRTEQAVFGGGCFWCTEALYQTLEGVAHVESGYAGGTVEDPTYEQVCSGETGHAEVIRITYDPSKISFRELVDFFWEAHDPTTLNRQGNDVGTQYRSVILYADEAQRAAAEASKADAQAKFDRPIVTEIAPLGAFYSAERYHQDFYNRNKDYPYCRYVIAPKLRKLEAKAK